MTAWYSKLGSKFGGKAFDDRDECFEAAPDAAFDFAEALEQGCCSGVTVALARVPVAGVEERLLVHRDEGLSNVTSLMNEAGDTLLVARASSDGLRFDMFLPRAMASGSSSRPPSPGSSSGKDDMPVLPKLDSRPSFSMVASDASCEEWALTSARCEQCQLRGRRRCGTALLAQVFHYTERVGAGQAYCMDVVVPEVSANGVAIGACKQCGTGSGAAEWTSELTSMRPKWSIRRKSLALDFRGRATKASAKNFQLCRAEEEMHSLLLFGKVEDQQFVLDFHNPLSAVHAFAITLTTAHWK